MCSKVWADFPIHRWTNNKKKTKKCNFRIQSNHLRYNTIPNSTAEIKVLIVYLMSEFYLSKHQVVIACAPGTPTIRSLTKWCVHTVNKQINASLGVDLFPTHSTTHPTGCRFQTSGQVNHSRDTAGCCIPFSTPCTRKTKSKWKNLLRQTGLSSDQIEFVGVCRICGRCRCVDRWRIAGESDRARVHTVLQTHGLGRTKFGQWK